MTLVSATSLPLLAARRQKRLKYWEERFASAGPGPDESGPETLPEIEDQLNTYRLLISKLVRAKSEPEKLEAEQRLSALERELTSLFEARRLMTTEIGVPAVGEK